MTKSKRTPNLFLQPFETYFIERVDQIRERITRVGEARPKMIVALVAFFALVATLACSFLSLPFAQPTPMEGKGTPELDIAPIGEIGQPGNLQLGSAVLDSVISTSDGETSGPILAVQVTNPSDDEVIVTIPCGLIFEPGPGSDEQRLMVIQQSSTTIPPGESAILTPYVVCIDSSNAVPEMDATYQVGVMANGDLLKLAQCICSDKLPDLESDPFAFMELMGVQFAVWTISDDLSFDDMFEGIDEAEGALGEIGGEELEEMLGAFTEMFTDPAQSWLEKCNIDINP